MATHSFGRLDVGSARLGTPLGHPAEAEKDIAAREGKGLSVGPACLNLGPIA